MPTTHTLTAERATLHGHFSRDLKPILTIASGDTVICNTLDAMWDVEPELPDHQDFFKLKKLDPRDEKLDSGHALIGPIAIEGAKAGMTLEVQIKTLRPEKWGVCLAGGWDSTFNKRYGVAESKGVFHWWEMNHETMIGKNQHGHRVALRPFMGVMGMPPNEPGIHPTIPPRFCGGNLDCKELVVGSSLYLPIAVDGGLFSVGDGHGTQGDGEISGTAIECGMEKVELTFHVRDDFPITTPVANTPAGWLTIGLHEDLNEATFLALNAMFELIQKLHHVSKEDAIGLASLTVDLRITQIVNRVCGVHAVLPHGAIR